MQYIYCITGEVEGAQEEGYGDVYIRHRNQKYVRNQVGVPTITLCSIYTTWGNEKSLDSLTEVRHILGTYQ